MSLATREQKAVMTDFAGDGPFGPLGRQKDMKERLEENASEQLRLRTAVYFMIISLSPWICNPRGLRQGFTTPYNYLGSQTLTFKSIGLQIRLDGFCSGFLTIDPF